MSAASPVIVKHATEVTVEALRKSAGEALVEALTHWQLADTLLEAGELRLAADHYSCCMRHQKRAIAALRGAHDSAKRMRA